MIGGAVDSRVVEMSFNNSNFEAGAKQSLSTIDRLKNALDFSKKAKSFEDVNNGIRSVNVNPLANGLQQVQAHFSALEVIGMRVLTNLTDKIMRMSEQFVRSLTIEPVRQGFGEYELKMNSVQTIMASTGKDIDTVNGYLNELNTYADKTIYSFSDMTASIGKFTNAGVDLDSAVKAIQGISNEAAVSGANANEASRAMYNFAQALSAGAVKLIDWKSIENANMATVEFKQSLMDTAVAMGTLKKDGDNYVSTTKDMQGKVSEAFTATHAFNESLSSQWMTTDVLIQTLGNYATDIREMSKEEKKAYEEKLASIGYTEEQIKAIEKLGQKAFDSAQDVKTFSQLLDTMKEGVGSSWAQIFETLFGNLEEAKKLWTQLAKDLGVIFVDPVDKLSGTLKKAFDTTSKIDNKKTGVLWAESLTTAMQGLTGIFNAAKEAASNIFPALTVKDIQALVENVYNAAVSFKSFAENSESLRHVLTGLFAGLDIVLQVFKALGSGAIATVRAILRGLGFDVGDTAASVADLITKFDEWLKSSNILSEAVRVVSETAGRVASSVREFIDAFMNMPVVSQVILEFKNGIKDASKSMPDFITGLLNLFTSWKRWLEFLDEHGGLTFSNLGNIIRKFHRELKEYLLNFPGFQSLIMAFKNLGALIKDRLSNAYDTFIEWLNKFKDENKDNIFGKIAEGILTGIDLIKSAFSKIKENTDIKNAEGAFNKIKAVFSTILDYLKGVDWKPIAKIALAFIPLKAAFSFFKDILTGKTLLGRMKELISNIGDAVSELGGVFKATKTQIKVDAFKAFAVAVALLAASIFALAMLDKDKMWGAVAALAVVVAMVLAVSYAMKKMDKKMGSGSSKGSLAIIAIALSVLLMVSALKKIQDLKADTLGRDIAILAGLIAAMVGVAWALSKMKGKMAGGAMSLIMLVLSVKLLAGVIQDIDGIKLENPLRTVGILAALVVALGALAKVAGNVTFTNGAGIILIAAAIAILAGVVKSLGQLSTEEWALGLIATALLAAIVSGLALVFDKLDFGFSQGAGIILIAAAIAILAGVVKSLGQLSTEEWALGLIATGLLAAIVSGLALVFDKLKFSVTQGAGMLLIAASISVLAGIVKLLGGMEQSDLIKGIVATALLAVILAGLSKVLSGNKLSAFNTAGILVAAAAIGVLAIVVKALGQLDTSELTKGIIAVALLGLVLAGIAKLMNGTEIKMKSLTGIVVMVAAVAILASVVALLAGLDPTRLAVATVCISSLMGMFALLMTVGKTAGELNIAVLMMLGVVIVLALVLNAVAQIPADRALAAAVSLSVLLLSLSAAMLILSAVGSMGAAVYQGMAALAVFIVGFGAIAVALGALTDKFPELELFLNKGIDILVKIGDGIGRFFGALIGGFSDQVLSYLPTIADSLVAFMTKMQELNGIGSINFEPLLAAFAAIIGVSFTEFLTAIPNLVSELVNGKSATEQFAEDLINIATSIMAWQAAMNMIGDIEIDASGIAGLAAVVAGISFAELFTAVTNLVSELVNGKSATEQFREDVENLALSLMAWDVAMTAVGDVDIDFSVITGLAAAVAGLSFEGFMTSIGDAVAEFLTGQSGLESFGDNLEELGKCLERWDTATQNINTDSLDATTVAIERLTNIGEKLKSQNLGGMFSESDYSKFGDALKTLGNALVGFSSIQVDATKLAGVSAIAGTVISTMGLFSSITIEGNIMDDGLVTTFISNINKLTAAINGLSSIDTSGVSRFKKAVEDISGTDLSGAVSSVADSGKAEMAQGGANAASAYVDSMASTIESSKGAVTSATSSLIDSTSKTIDAASKTFVASGKKITEALASGVRSSSALTGAVQSIVNSASNVSVSSFTSLGRNIIAGIASGINSNSALVANAVAAAVNAGYQEGLRRSQSHSPSRLFMKIGNYIIQGFAKGITDHTDLSRKAADEMVDSTVDQANSAIRRLRDVLSGGVDGDPVIRPVLDLSEIQNGANGIADMLHMNDPIPVLDNFGAISNNSAMIRRRATTDDIMTALASNGGGSSGDTYIIEGITYDDGSNITEAVRTLVHGVKVGRRA